MNLRLRNGLLITLAITPAVLYLVFLAFYFAADLSLNVESASLLLGGVLVSTVFPVLVNVLRLVLQAGSPHKS